MTILEMPPIGGMASRFEIERVDYVAPETSGRQGGVQAGWPRWEMELSLNNMVEAKAGPLRAWLRRMRGSQRLFIAHDQWRPFPFAHHAGFGRMLRIDGSPFTGSATGWTQSIDADGNAILELTNVPSGLRLTEGDYVGFKWDAAGSAAGTYDRRALVSVVAPAIASAVGTISVMIEPPVPAISADPLTPGVVPAIAIAHLDQPACLMKLTSDTKAPKDALGYVDASGMISAAQVLLP